MNGRLIAGVVFCMVAAAVNIGMLWGEELEPGPKKAKATSGPSDALAELQYVPSDREANFKKMGFDPAQISTIMTEISGLEQRLHLGDKEKDQIAYLIDNTDEGRPMENAFCGRYTELPGRYAAMEFLVEESQGELRVRDLAQMNQFDGQDWFAGGQVSAVVSKVELVAERHEDATRMGIAAVLAREADSVLEGKAPWGASMWNNWAWEGVVKKYESIGSKVMRYAAIMHLVLESTNGEGGLCRTE